MSPAPDRRRRPRCRPPTPGNRPPPPRRTPTTTVPPVTTTTTAAADHHHGAATTTSSTRPRPGPPPRPSPPRRTDDHVVQHPVGPRSPSSWCWSSPSWWSPSCSGRAGRRAVEAEWRRAVVPALSDAQLARDVAALRQRHVRRPRACAVRWTVQVEKAAVALERAGAGRARPAGRRPGHRRRPAALRGLAFAVEADRLLRQGSLGAHRGPAGPGRRGPAGPELASCSAALVRLSTRIGSARRSRGTADRRRPESIGPVPDPSPPPPMSPGPTGR